jgi:hypothetical protein
VVESLCQSLSVDCFCHGASRIVAGRVASMGLVVVARRALGYFFRLLCDVCGVMLHGSMLRKCFLFFTCQFSRLRERLIWAGLSHDVWFLTTSPLNPASVSLPLHVCRICGFSSRSSAEPSVYIGDGTVFLHPLSCTRHLFAPDIYISCTQYLSICSSALGPPTSRPPLLQFLYF